MMFSLSSVDWQIVTTISSLVFAAGSLFVAFATMRWNRRESKHDKLEHLLQKCVKAMQTLESARIAMITAENLKKSFPADLSEQNQASARYKDSVNKFGNHIAEGSRLCKEVEQEISSVSFRFPDRISQPLNDLKSHLFLLGTSLNNVDLPKAELVSAKLTDTYRLITARARGWNLFDPLKIAKCCLSAFNHTRVVEDEYPFDLSPDRMDLVVQLVRKRITSEASNTFAIHPPKLILDDPAVLESDSILDKLEDSVFSVVFQDGQSEMLTLPELLVFVWQVINLTIQAEHINKKFSSVETGFNVDVELRLNVNDIMKPEMAKVLLSKVDFSPTPSD